MAKRTPRRKESPVPRYLSQEHKRELRDKLKHTKDWMNERRETHLEGLPESPGPEHLEQLHERLDKISKDIFGLEREYKGLKKVGKPFNEEYAKSVGARMARSLVDDRITGIHERRLMGDEVSLTSGEKHVVDGRAYLAPHVDIGKKLASMSSSELRNLKGRLRGHAERLEAEGAGRHELMGVNSLLSRIDAQKISNIRDTVLESRGLLRRTGRRVSRGGKVSEVGRLADSWNWVRGWRESHGEDELRKAAADEALEYIEDIAKKSGLHDEFMDAIILRKRPPVG